MVALFTLRLHSYTQFTSGFNQNVTLRNFFLFRCFISCLDPPLWLHGWCLPSSRDVHRCYYWEVVWLCICVCIWIWIMLRINKRCVSVSLWPPLAGPLTGSWGRHRTNHHGSISTTASVSPSSFILIIIVDWLFWSYYCFWCIFPLSAHSGTQSSMPGLCSITGNGAPLCLSPLFWTSWWDIILRNRQTVCLVCLKCLHVLKEAHTQKKPLHPQSKQGGRWHFKSFLVVEHLRVIQMSYDTLKQTLCFLLKAARQKLHSQWWGLGWKNSWAIAGEKQSPLMHTGKTRQVW